MADLNPLDGQPLKPGQILVTGDPLTGPRLTVITIGAPLPRWISRRDRVVNGVTVSSYFDNGLPSATYPGPQVLPELTVTGSPSWLVVLVVIAIVGGLAALRARGGISWGD